MVLKERGCRSKKNSLSNKKKLAQSWEVVGWLVVHLSVSNNQPAPSLFREKKLLLISLKRIEEL